MSICPMTQRETPSIFIPEAPADPSSALWLSRSQRAFKIGWRSRPTTPRLCGVSSHVRGLPCPVSPDHSLLAKAAKGNLSQGEAHLEHSRGKGFESKSSSIGVSRLLCLRALFPGTPPLSPLLTWASSPAPSFHFKGLALSGSHILLDDKLIKLDFLDEIDTKELQLPTGPKVNTALLAPIRVTKGYLRAIFLPAWAEGWS